MKTIPLLLISYLFFNISIQAHDDLNYFSPKLYQNLWPDFCIQHLKDFPLACSEQHTDECGNFYFDFLEGDYADAYIDKEIISRLSNYLNLIPTNSIKEAGSAKSMMKKKMMTMMTNTAK